MLSNLLASCDAPSILFPRTRRLVPGLAQSGPHIDEPLFSNATCCTVGLTLNQVPPPPFWNFNFFRGGTVCLGKSLSTPQSLNNEDGATMQGQRSIEFPEDGPPG